MWLLVDQVALQSGQSKSDRASRPEDLPVAIPRVVNTIVGFVRASLTIENQFVSSLAFHIALISFRGDLDTIGLAIGTRLNTVVFKGVCGVRGLKIEADVVVIG